MEYVYFFTENEAVLQQSHLLHGADGTVVSGAQYQGLASRAAMEEIHREFPQIKLIGPTNWGPPFGASDGRDFVGDRFEDTLKPYLEAVWDQLHAFNYHNYYLGYTRENTGELQTLINFMRVRFGEEKPIFMNEGNLGGGDWATWVKWDDRALWLYNGFIVLRALMWGIDNLDKQQVLCWHDWGGAELREHAADRPEPVGLPRAKPRPDLMNNHPMPFWTALWLFRQLRGDTLHAEAAPGTQVAAAYDGEGYSVVVVNHSLVDRDLNVRLKTPAGRRIESISVEYNEPGEDFYRFDAGTLAPDRWWRAGGGMVTIRARALAAYHVRVTLDKATAPSRVAGGNEHFGDRVMVRLNRYRPKGEILIACPASVRRAKRAWLRIAYESLLLEPEEVIWKFNGQPIIVDRRDYIQIPLTPRTLRRENVLSFRLKDPQTRNDLRVRSAVVAVEYGT